MAHSLKINLSDTKSSNETDLLFSINGLKKRIRISTGVKCLVKDWDNTKQEVRRSNSNFGHINRLLSKRKTELDKILLIYASDTAQTNKDDIKKQLSWIKNATTQKVSYDELKQLFLASKKRDVKEDTYNRKYVSPFNVIEAFSTLKKVPIDVHSFSEKELIQFQDYCYNERGNTNNGFDKTVNVLKTFLKWCHEKGHTENNYYKEIKRTATQPEIHPLTQYELHILENTDKVFSELKEQVKDVFLFLCYTGLRFSDAFRLSKSHIKSNTIHFVTEKTQKKVKIPIHERTRLILDKYDSINTGYVFPKIDNVVFNRYLKDIFSDLELNRVVEIVEFKRRNAIRTHKKLSDVVSSHDGRRTFITLSLSGGMNAWQLMTVTGHEKFETFKKYVKFTDEEITNRLLEVWNKI